MSRLLVVRLSAMGDVIHTIPAVLSLQAEHEVTWVVEAPYRELVELVTGAKTIPVRMKQWTRHPGAAREALRAMRGFDTAIDFQGLIKSAALPWAARVPRRIGFARDAVREKPALLLNNEHVSVDTTLHVIEQNLLLAAATSQPRPPETSVGRASARLPGTNVGRASARLPETNVGRASARLPGGEGKTRPAEARPRPNWRAFTEDVPGFGDDIVLLPGAGKPDKIWPVERFRELALRIGPKALAVWGPGEKAMAEAIGARMAPPTNLRQLAAILGKARVVIGADTGPLHLAAALGTKVIGLYGPTDPRRNGPYGQLSRVIDRFPTTKSMESISVEEVMKTLERVSAE